MLLGGINLLLDNKKDQIIFENKIRTPKIIESTSMDQIANLT